MRRQPEPVSGQVLIGLPLVGIVSRIRGPGLAPGLYTFHINTITLERQEVLYVNVKFDNFVIPVFWWEWISVRTKSGEVTVTLAKYYQIVTS